MFKQRIITALILIPLLILVIFKMPSAYFSKLSLVLIAIAGWEFSALIKLKKLLARFLFISSVIIIFLICLEFNFILPFILYLSVLWWLINIYWIMNYQKKITLWSSSIIMRITSGILFIAPMFVVLNILHSQYDLQWILLLMLLIWGNDSGAYFIGKALGTHKLAPKISPNKSIEGAIGGIASTFIIIFTFMQYYNIDINNYIDYLMLAIIVSTTSILGDLYESLLKRATNIKDSGTIFPGHGGILDRTDSLAAAAPFFLLGLNIL